MAGDGPLQSWPWTVSWARPRGDSRAIGHVFFDAGGNPLGLHTVQDLAERRTRVVLATLQEAGAREQYLDTLSMLAPLGCGEGDPGPVTSTQNKWPFSRSCVLYCARRSMSSSV
jgi:hypothetical protein